MPFKFSIRSCASPQHFFSACLLLAILMGGRENTIEKVGLGLTDAFGLDPFRFTYHHYYGDLKVMNLDLKRSIDVVCK